MITTRSDPVLFGEILIAPQNPLENQIQEEISEYEIRISTPSKNPRDGSVPRVPVSESDNGVIGPLSSRASSPALCVSSLSSLTLSPSLTQHTYVPTRTVFQIAVTLISIDNGAALTREPPPHALSRS